MSRKVVFSLLLVVLLLSSTAWTPGPDPKQPANLDDLFEQVGRQAPGFGGMFRDGDVLKIYLTNQGQERRVQDAIAAVFGPDSIPGGGVAVLPARYNFGQLRAWHNHGAALLDVPGVVYTDIDETSNQLKVGVESAESFGQVQAELRRLGIPPEAVQVILTDPIVQLATLQQYQRPLAGGLQINFPGYLCTYGFNATRAGVPGFVTNSHCTAKQGGVDNTPYWQPLQSAGYPQIGTETLDPLYTRATCPVGLKGKVCRYSDSAFVTLAAAAQFTLGDIEQTNGLSSLTIAGTYHISGERATVNGETVNKVGRTTGWSQGKVSGTCMNVGVQGSKVVELCQNMVDAAVGAGDSGSPVFALNGSANVALLGILWGGNSAGTQFVFSPMAGIERSDELGSLTTY
jgi:hypothetical protein